MRENHTGAKAPKFQKALNSLQKIKSSILIFKLKQFKLEFNISAYRNKLIETEVIGIKSSTWVIEGRWQKILPRGGEGQKYWVMQPKVWNEVNMIKMKSFMNGPQVHQVFDSRVSNHSSPRRFVFQCFLRNLFIKKCSFSQGALGIIHG